MGQYHQGVSALLNQVTGKTYRLLSQAEWEYAARGVTDASKPHTVYSWGDEIKLNGQAMANCAGCGSHWDERQTAVPSNRTLLVSMTCMAMCGRWWRTAGRKGTMKARRLMAPFGQPRNAICTSFAAVPGTTIRGTCARRAAAGPPPTVAAPASS